jgi:Icc-related predicted phosphoesterase
MGLRYLPKEHLLIRLDAVGNPSRDAAGNMVPAWRLSFMNASDPVSIRHRAQSLRVLAFSDYHAQNIDQLIDFVKQRRRPHLILYGGDATERFHENGRNRFEELACLSAFGLCAVAGNDDHADSGDIQGDRVYAVHMKPVIVGGFAVVGLEGCPLFLPPFKPDMNRGHLMYPEHSIAHQIQFWEQFVDKKVIVVSHAPPFGVLDEAMRFGRRHIGSHPLRDYLDSHDNATLCVCGHVHSQSRKSEMLRSCTVVNVASHDKPRDPGNVAEIVVNNDGVQRITWHALNPSPPAGPI